MRPRADATLAEDLADAALSLARRFAAGATMWCTSPQWPAHARHVAVEFVHPVVVGKRALPAVCIEGGDLVTAVRLVARPGDVVLAIGASSDDDVSTMLRHAPAWDVTSFWLGTGPRPRAGSADHVLWAESDDAVLAARSGHLVAMYHLLWELTHVVFEHPGLLRTDAPCTDDVCITCSDEGRLAEVVSVRDRGIADVVAAGQRATIDVSLVEPVAVGDLVLVHAGLAITVLPEQPK